MRLCELEEKEVINACDCKRLGFVADLIIEECTGRIESLIVPKSGKLCGFFCDGEEYVIPYACVKKIGPDIILVEIHERNGKPRYKVQGHGKKYRDMAKSSLTSV